MTEIGAWKHQLWAELDSLPPEEQFVTTSEWITWIAQSLLPELGRRRRQNAKALVDVDDASIATVASNLGMRRSTLSRLLDEERADRKQQTLDREVAAARSAEAIAA